MGMQQSYFAIGNPLSWLDRRLHPYRHMRGVPLNRQIVEVAWTQRAERELARRDTPLLVEMQLYFSCVVKKRVLFHEQNDLAFTPANERLAIAFRPVEASSCDPVAFAENYPERREMSATGASKMRAKRLRLDFRKGEWQGEFDI